MKYAPLFIALMLILGCGNSESTSIGQSGEKPGRIVLTFNSLELTELPQGDVSSEWQFIKSIPFGVVDNKAASLEIYKVESTNEVLPDQINGVLKINDLLYQIFDLSTSFIEDGVDPGSQVSLFQRRFSEQKQLFLLGSVELFANGPGLHSFIVYDERDNKIKTFDGWGEPSFVDLDNDGYDEFIIEFQGLHLSWPDISIVKENNGVLEISTSVFNMIDKNPGDFAKLAFNNEGPTIDLSNAETETIYSYTYNDGVLEKVKNH